MSEELGEAAAGGKILRFLPQYWRSQLSSLTQTSNRALCQFLKSVTKNGRVASTKELSDFKYVLSY